MKKPGIFITGTGTDVGKTIISAGLALVLKSRGIKVGVMKPIATGCIDFGKNLVSEDATFLFEAAENEFTGLTSPSRYRHPVSPNVAAQVENKPVDIEVFKKAYEEMSEHYDFIIVEGIGGLMVPISQDYFVTDLIRDLNLPIIIVSNAGLGAINHTLLTIDAAAIRGFKIHGIIFNRIATTNVSLSEITNPKVVHDISQIPVLGTLPEIEGLNMSRCSFGNLKEVFEERMNLDFINELIPS